jgi:hypothetical protein
MISNADTDPDIQNSSRLAPHQPVHPAAAKVTGVILLFAYDADIYFHCNR